MGARRNYSRIKLPFKLSRARCTRQSTLEGQSSNDFGTDFANPRKVAIQTSPVLWSLMK